MGTTPSLEEIIEAGVQSALSNLYTAQPALVISFDATHHTCVVQPLVKKHYQGEDGTTLSVPQPLIANVPVVFPGATDYRITFPIKKGATVLLVHTSVPLDGWQFSRGSVPVEPKEMRKHSITDCFAIPGILTSVAAGGKSSGGSGKVEDDAVTIHTAGKIFLGGGITSPVVTTVDDVANIKAVLSNPTVVAAQGALIAALLSGVGVPAAQTALNNAIDGHFIAHPADGSDVVEAE